MNSLSHCINSVLHIDVYLNTFVSTYGFWTYLLLFLIIFCETGLIVTPLLPGDSLLFAAGSIAAQPDNSFNVILLFALLVIASILGNQLNFTIGKWIGPQVFKAKDSWLFNKKHLESAHQFYITHGKKTIIIARFLPIIRTFAPFIAGIGQMSRIQFLIYNVLSAFLWIGALLGLGYFLGSLPFVKEHFTAALYGIIILSLFPALITCLRKKSNHADPWPG